MAVLPGVSDLVALLEARAEHNPELVAFHVLPNGEPPGRDWTFGALAARARAIGARLQGMTRPGDRAMLLFPSDLEYIAAFFGCLYARVVAVPVYPPDPAQLERSLVRLTAILRDCDPSLILTSRMIGALARPMLATHAEFARPQWVTTDTVPGEEGASWQPPRLADDDLAFLQYTSGSTGTPKGVRVSHGNLLHNQEAIRRLLGMTPEDVVVGWVPLYHDMGLIGHVLHPVYQGTRAVLMPPTSFLQKPLRWLRAISKYRGTAAGAPNFAYDLCVRKVRPAELEELELSSWRIALNGAEPVRHDTVERFCCTFAPCGFRREAFVPSFGIAEATLIVSGRLPIGPPTVIRVHRQALRERRLEEVPQEDRAGQDVVSCGRTIPEHPVTIVDPELGVALSEDRVGEIWLRSPSIAQGYWGNVEQTRLTFAAFLASGEGPFLRTGDLGFLRQGELYVVGRLKDTIIIHGRNHYPQDLEATAATAHPLLRPGGCAAFGLELDGEERLAIVCEAAQPTADADPILGAVRTAIWAEHGVSPHLIVLTAPKAVHKTSSGKVQRRATRTAYLEGKLPILAMSSVPVEPGPMAGSEVEPTNAAGDPTVPEAAGPPHAAVGSGSTTRTRWNTPGADRRALLRDLLVEELAATFATPPSGLVTDRPLSQLGLDSIQAIELAYRLEEELQVELGASALLSGATLDQLAAELDCRLQADPGTLPGPTAATAEGAAHDSAPLSRAQQSIWFHWQLAPETRAYNLGLALGICSPVDVEVLREAVLRLVQRHGQLRTVFVQSGDRVTQHEEPVRESAFEHLRLPGADDDEFRRRIDGLFERRFVPVEGHLFSAYLLTRGAADHALVLRAHHLVCDGWSIWLLLDELQRLYTALRRGEQPELPALGRRAPDFVAGEQVLLAGERGRALAHFWKEQLTGAPPLTTFPADRPRPAIRTEHFAGQRFTLEAGTVARTRQLARQEGATLFATLLAAYQVLLGRYSGQQDVCVASPASLRTGAGFRDVVGCFVNLLVLRTDLSGNPTFRELLGRTRQTVLNAMAHQEYPFSQVVDDLHPVRDLSHAPLVQAGFNLQRPQRQATDLARLVAGEPEARVHWGDLLLTPFAVQHQVGELDLELELIEVEDRLAGVLKYNTDLWESATAARLVDHFARLLDNLVTVPDRPVREAPLMAPDEQHRILHVWNETRAEQPPDACVHRLFEEQVRQTPEAPALWCAGRWHSYLELDRRADALVGRLNRRGLGPGNLVGLHGERNVDTVAAMLGVMKVGAAFVPLDPRLPTERLQAMIDDGRPSVLLTGRELADHLPAGPTPLELLDELSTASTNFLDTSPVRRTPSPDDLVYVMYTSGTTGRPKGVQIAHGNLVNLLLGMRARPGMAQRDVLLALTTFSFDISMLELFLPLCCGARVVLLDAEAVRDPAAIRRALQEHNVTVMQATPSGWRLLLDSGWPGRRELKALCGGEPLPEDLATALRPRVGSLWNMYGPTETTVWSTTGLVEDGPVTIGRPIRNTRVYLLDEALAPVPLGATGRLFIGGEGVSPGYLGAPALTAERFRPDPFAEGGRIYDTGDLARFLPDGRLVHLGRADRQVKLRGFRIELEEVEGALGRHPEVRVAYALIREDRPGDRRLVAYLVAGAREPSVAELRTHLAQTLPDYMLPEQYVFLPELPLSPAGKIDARALPRPSDGRSSPRTLVPPSSAQTRLIAAVWCEVLGLTEVGVHDNFFELGGNSLLLSRVHAGLPPELGERITLLDLYRYPTIQAITDRLNEVGSPPGESPHAPHAAERSQRQTVLQDLRSQRLARRPPRG